MKTSLALFCALVLAPGIPAFSQEVPHCLFYHGTLTTAGGSAVSTPKTMVFSIWSQASGGSMLWQETHSAVPVSQGHFSVMLGGAGNAIPSSVFSDTLRYLQVVIDGETLTPRQRLGSVPFAYRSAAAPGLTLPFSESASSVGSLFRVENTNSSPFFIIGVPKAAAWFTATHAEGVVGTGGTRGVSGNSQSGEGVRGTHSTSGNYGVLGGSTSSVYGRTTGGSASGGPNYGGFFEGVGDYSGGVIAKAGRFGYAGDFWGPVVVRNRTGSRVLEMGEGLDYAEGFDYSGTEKPAPGTVLVLDPEHPGSLATSTSPYDTRVAGIVAGARGLGSGVRLGSPEFDVDVALAGRVYCAVDATDEGVNVGDLLTTSSTPGHAMKATDRARMGGSIIGKAMEPLPRGSRGTILVLVTLQ